MTIILSAMVSLIVSAIVARLTVWWTANSDEKRAIREGTMRIIGWAIEYPFLESDDFCRSWPNTTRTDDDRLRYENYCCHVFNQLEHAWELFKGDERKMRCCLCPKELIVRHRKWWEDEPDNDEGYSVEFRQFVANILRRVDRGPKNE